MLGNLTNDILDYDLIKNILQSKYRSNKHRSFVVSVWKQPVCVCECWLLSKVIRVKSWNSSPKKVFGRIG